MNSNKEGSSQRIARVPLSYGPKQKFISRLEQNPDLEDQNIALKLPRMSFEIIAINYDAPSKLNKMNKCVSKDNVIYTPVPYIIDFSLSVYGKNQDDVLQIVEQIIPYFDPTYEVTINNEDLGIKTDVPITYNGDIGIEDSYEGDYLSRRAIIYTLTFSMKVSFYKGSTKAKPIYNVGVNFGEDEAITVSYDEVTEECEVTIDYIGDFDSRSPNEKE